MVLYKKNTIPNTKKKKIESETLISFVNIKNWGNRKYIQICKWKLELKLHFGFILKVDEFSVHRVGRTVTLFEKSLYVLCRLNLI